MTANFAFLQHKQKQITFEMQLMGLTLKKSNLYRAYHIELINMESLSL